MPSREAAAALLLLLLQTTGAPACTNDLGCSLGGACTDGRCVCDAWFAGPTCARLNLAPTPLAVRRAYTRRDARTGTQENTWGGSPVWDSATSTWTLFLARMGGPMQDCTLASWFPYSTVIRASSSSGSVLGPYSYAGEVVGAFAHNPTAKRLPNGSVAGLRNSGAENGF